MNQGKTQKDGKTATVAGTARAAAPEEFTDGYVDWNGFDEDGTPEEGTADVTSAVVDGDTLLVNLEYDSSTYVVRMTKAGDEWAGTYKCMDGGRLASTGRCRAKASPSEPGERVFEGRWMEHETAYKWMLLLRAPAGPRKKSAPSAPPPPRTVPLDRYARQKLLRLAAFVEQVAREHDVDPELLATLLAAHAALKVPPK